MSSIKNLFSKGSTKVLTGRSLTTIAPSGGLESPDFLRSTEKEKKKFEPFVDFSSAENFARYGSAEKYYDDSIGYIINLYPYDGSLKEKANWYNSSSYFDTYLFENEYPRTTGYINLGVGYGTLAGGTNGYSGSTRQEYIFLKGGPHTASAGMTGKPLSLTFTGSNYYDVSKDRVSNLNLDLTNGNTVEFWFKKDSYIDGSESPKQIFFDVWNSASFSDSAYTRFRIECDFTASPHQFNIVYTDFTGNGFNETFPGTIGQNLNFTSSVWNHYAISTICTPSGDTQAQLYVNGNLNDTVLAGADCPTFPAPSGSMLGWVGALGTSSAGTHGNLGFAKLSGSLDELRFWKVKRTDTQIGRYWFSQVGAGSNTDSANTDLGFYYKFNEGIMNADVVNALDSKVLDYSGRVTNGNWIGYTTGSRSTNSAMVESSASLSEFKDPILYPTNPEIVSFISAKRKLAVDYDFRNNSGIYSSLPEWITGDEAELNSGNIKSLVQIIGSYFDSLFLQIQAVPELKNIQYSSGSQKPIPFTSRFLESLGLYAPEIFADANELEYYASRDDYRQFSEKIGNIKNKIYENIYNNIVYIFKSKGTEKSFRNLIRCYGIDEPLVKLNLYADNLAYQLKDNTRSSITRKKFIDFNNTDRFDSTVYQQTASTNLNTRNFITASSDMSFVPNTMEAEVIFPDKIGLASTLYFPTNFLTCSLFGCHTPLNDQSDMTWATPDVSSFQVHAVRGTTENADVYFKLTSSAGGVIPTLTSSVFKDVYSNSKWNFGVRVSPRAVEAPAISGSDVVDFLVEFVGYNSILDNVENSFYLSSSILVADGNSFLSNSKRVFVGAERVNFTGSGVAPVEKCDAKISSVRYWISDLPNETIEAHSKDASSLGTLEPHQSAYLTKNTAPYFEAIEVPQIKTLALNWSFDNVTGSGNSSGAGVSDASFLVEDMSSGSLTTTSSYGWLGPVVNMQHTGKGDFFLAASTGSVSREYVYSAKLSPPEVLNSSDMVSIRRQDDDLFTRETRPIDYFYAIEKSQAAIISEEMINWFSTIKDFNFLIGDPVNRYRQNYKSMDKLRATYFATIGNTINFEKFVEYFKWIDDALSVMLSQLVPASANFADKVRLLIESHILERNKYLSKFPTLDMKIDDPEAGLRGIVEGLYPWARGHAPIPMAQDDNCFWAHNRAERTKFSSGDATIDSQRDTYKEADDFRTGTGPTLSTIDSVQYEGSTYALRNFTKPYRFTVKEMKEIHGGSNFPKAKTVEYTHESLKFGSSDQLEIAASSIAHEKDCNDVIDPNIKNRLECKVTNTGDANGYLSGKGTLLAPFSLFSSSVESGYASSVATNFRTKTGIDNYHDDIYGDDKGIPVQGPFTENHVGGRQHRHINVNTEASTTTQTRPEAWNLSMAANTLTVAQRSVNEPRATMIRDEYAKRPLNIRNIKWGTSSQTAGNYRLDYEILQTSGRKMNNRFFVKNEGFYPEIITSPYISGVVDYVLPRFDLTGSNKYVFVERFNAPGGPDVSSRGAMDINAEEYSVYNEMNQRNLVVRKALDGWYTDHCGVFGTEWKEGTVSDRNYNTDASYHKVNRNRSVKYKLINWSDVTNMAVGHNGTSLRKISGGVSWSNAGAAGDYKIIAGHGIQFDFARPSLPLATNQQVIIGMSVDPPALTHYSDIKYGIYRHTLGIVPWVDGAMVPGYFDEIYGATYSILRFGGKVYFFVDNTVFYSTVDTALDVVLRPDITMERVGGQVYGVKCFSVDNTFDNWYVQNAIPRSDLQYAWIDKSYDREKNQPPGHVGSADEGRSNFSVPLGNANSTTASVIQFSTASNWIFPTFGTTSVLERWKVNYAQMWFGNKAVTAFPAGAYKYQIGTRSPEFFAARGTKTRPDTKGIRVETIGGGAGWGSHAIAGRDNILDGESLEFEVAQLDAELMVGLNTDPPALASYTDMSYAIQLRPVGYWGTYDIIRIWENNSVVADSFEILYKVGDTFRIKRENQTILYQYSSNGKDYTTLYVSKQLIPGNLFFDCTLCCTYPVTGQKITVRNVRINVGTNMVVPGYGFVSGVLAGGVKLPAAINMYFNNLNGPYGYPSWKQIKTGETPVARYQKAHNIITFKKEESLFAGNNFPKSFQGLTKDSIMQFVEPPVTFRNKPLRTVLSMSGATEPLPIYHTYGNNLTTFTNPKINNFLGSIKCDEQMYDRIKKMYINPPADTPVEQFLKMDYDEIVYPREIYTGLKKTRQRTQYAEISAYSGSYCSASLSNESNGIDRGPLSRRTFWRDTDCQRNRRGQHEADIWYAVSASYSRWEGCPTTGDISGIITIQFPLTFSGPTKVISTLPNSQGYYDGFATSVYGLGRTPINFAPMSQVVIYSVLSYGLNAVGSYIPPRGSLSLKGDGESNRYGCWAPTAVACRSDTGSFNVTASYLENYPDMGELNSCNVMTINGYFGTAFMSGLYQSSSMTSSAADSLTASWAARTTYYPTASAYYYHQSKYVEPFGQADTLRGKFPWRVSELSGKKPWFDTYEDYVQDIRGTGKNYTIVPEFRISQHMPYYASGQFKKQNDKFLTLEGAEVTCSSAGAEAPQGTTTRRTGFSKEFFSEYSNTDFQKYFGKFSTDHDVANITLKCNAIKKLLPYYGFYPVHRTLQLASLFSQSLGPYISGLDWLNSKEEKDTGSCPPICSTALTGALNMQSLLQPYFAPGIMYNTIKSGIAVDWGAYTGSAAGDIDADVPSSFKNKFNKTAPNYRIPFESILDPLGDIGIPDSNSAGTGKMFLNYPTYGTEGLTSVAGKFYCSSEQRREPYVEMNERQRGLAMGHENYNLYKLAANNFFAEIPNFFLSENRLKSIVSPKAKEQGQISMVSGTDYYMNVVCWQDPKTFMIQDYWDGDFPLSESKGQTANFGLAFCYDGMYLTSSAYKGIQQGKSWRSFNGRYFGPPVWAGCAPNGFSADQPGQWGWLAASMGDPAFAPYTPSYFYGKSIVTIKYTATGEDVSNFSYLRLFKNAQVTRTNPVMDGMFHILSASKPSGTYGDCDVERAILGLTDYPAKEGAMQLEASFNMFGLFQEKQTDYDADGNLIRVVDDPNPSRNRWVISPKMETPVLDFNKQPRVLNTGRGMWGGYGETITGSGIQFGIEETFKEGFDPIITCEGGGGFSLEWDKLNVANVTITYNADLESTVSKSAGSTAAWDAGVVGTRKVKSGEAWEWTIDQFSDNILCGLNDDTTAGTDPLTMNYGVQSLALVAAVCFTAIDTTGANAGVVGGTDVTFTINIPTAAGGEGGAITITLQDDDVTGVIGAGASAIGIGGMIGAPGTAITDAQFAERIINAINGVSGDRVTLATSGLGTSGVGGITAWEGLSDTQINLVMDTAGADGNITGFLASTGGVDIITSNSFTGGTARGNLDVYEGGNNLGTKADYAAGDQVRIVRGDDDAILYQHASGTTQNFTSFFTSTRSAKNLVLYPDCSIYALGSSISKAIQLPWSNESCTTQNRDSLLKLCFEKPTSKQIGELAEEKEISEAIVAIPFAVKGTRATTPPHDRALTTTVLGKNFFKIEQGSFDFYKKWFLTNKNAESKNPPVGPSSVSIQKMLTLMDKYIIPPELDFLTFYKGSKMVKPFVMYMFEFNETLKEQDLADIWQGLMPDIARTAQLADPNPTSHHNGDDNIFSHPTGPFEFFHGKKIPQDIRWLVFKVKKRANFDYYKITADTTDDNKFDFSFDVGGVELPYSYNWPYDYFSLVELAQIEVGSEFITKVPKVEVAGTEIVTENLNSFQQAARSGQVRTATSSPAQATTTTTNAGGSTGFSRGGGTNNPPPGGAF